jgi:formate-dependent nitrite reductase membrane component NrfD
MREELITSGRMNPNIDPILHVWHWSIPLYLFLGGLAAGLLFFAAFRTLTGDDKKYGTSVKIGPIIAFAAIVVGLMALLYDLNHPLYFWQLYTTIRIVSPMSWGAWTLLIMVPLNLIWIFSYLKEIVPVNNIKINFLKKIISWVTVSSENITQNWEWKHKMVKDFEKFVQNNRKPWAWSIIILALILGVYTGILLSAFNARPLWNTSILGPLFLTSGLSTGAALIMLITKDHNERRSYSKIDILLIIIELFFITHLFMGFQAGSQVNVEAAYYFLGGEFTVTFWVNVVILGLAIPAILEVLELLNFKVPIYVPGLLIIWGGLAFRFIMVDAGQVIRYLY